MALSTPLLKPVWITAALLLAHAAQAQQASFNVMVTLRYPPQPMAASQFCPDGQPLTVFGKSSVRVQCPAGLHNKTTANQNTETVGRRNANKPTEVLVTF